MNDLLALATVRRLLLQLGYELGPERPGALVGPLEVWVHEARADLDGQSPLQALRIEGGEGRVRESLRAMFDGNQDDSRGFT